MRGKFSRRNFLKAVLATAGGGLGLSIFRKLGITPSRAQSERHVYLTVVDQTLATPTPIPAPTPKPGSSVVVHTHNVNATSWDFSTGYYWNNVNQQVVNTMVSDGIKRLTGQATQAAAWRTLLPGYSAGKGIAVKVNFNNADMGSCSYRGNMIDALAEPVNALILGMKEMGVRAQDIWIYDAIRPIPSIFKSKVTAVYSGVRFFNGSNTCGELATFNDDNQSSHVYFSQSSLIYRLVTEAIMNASYLINVPIIKDHGISGVSLGFKNHFGTLNQIVKSGDDNLHYFICPSDPHYSTSKNPLLDIFKNPNISGKTVLTVGDALYGALENTVVNPKPWKTFNNDAPNSIFLSRDPVAIDCVMMDILDAEPVYHPQRNGADNYLRLASAAGFGVYERGKPWGSGYTKINYIKL